MTFQQALILSPHPIYFPLLGFHAWTILCPLISSLLHYNGHANLEFLCLLPVVDVCAYYYMCIYADFMEV